MPRRKFNYKNLAFNKFIHLLALLLITFLLSPVWGRLETAFPVLSFVFLLSIILILRTLSFKKHTIYVCMGVAAFAFLLDVLFSLEVLPTQKDLLAFISTLAYTIFVFMAVVLIMRRLFALKEVNIDTIVGGICVYLLLGFLWILFYALIAYFDLAAFSIDILKRPMSLFYFSYTTLTTLGYGDITPVNRFAMVLSSLEAITGQIYLTVFVARLVGLYITHEIKKIQ